MAGLYQNQPQPASPSGDPFDLASLPPPDTTRWVAGRKAQVVAAVEAGLLSLDEALARYGLSLEEFSGWQRALCRHGVRGLQVTHLQHFTLAEHKRRTGGRCRRKMTLWERQHA